MQVRLLAHLNASSCSCMDETRALSVRGREGKKKRKKKKERKKKKRKRDERRKKEKNRGRGKKKWMGRVANRQTNFPNVRPRIESVSVSEGIVTL